MIADFGMVLGMALALFLIEVFDARSQIFVYPFMLAFTILGGAAYFKADEFFTYFMQIVGALIAVQGLTGFLNGQFPTFAESIT